MRTQYPSNGAYFNNLYLVDVFSLVMWGGATFDLAMFFLNKCPWKVIKTLREKVPDVLFQILLCGANTVGYTNYPNNLVQKFCKQASKSGVEIFRIFNSINYIDNLKLGGDAAGSVGGFMEGTLSYTGGVLDPRKVKYDLEYYIKITRDLSDMGF